MTPDDPAVRVEAGRPGDRVRRPDRFRTAAIGLLAAGALLLAITVPALANGGIVRISRAPVGPWFVTVYSSPTPLRTGEVDISTLVQDSADRVLDVPIMVDATPVGFVAEPVYSPATRAQATNKLFKAAKFDIGVPGRWQFRVRVGDAAAPADAADAEHPAGVTGPADTPGTADPIGAAATAGRDAPGGVVSFEAVVTKSTILDRPFLLATLIGLPLLVLGWILLGREKEEVSRGSRR